MTIKCYFRKPKFAMKYNISEREISQRMLISQ